MKDALHYILSEVKSKRLAKTDALDLIRQFETKTITNKSSYFNPLLHQNTSNFTEQRFSSTFIGEEFFLTDHMVKGKKMLPGVAYLEMARAAVEQAAGDLEDDQTGIRLENVLWIRPIIAGEEPIQVHIGLFLDDKGLISFEIYTEQNNAEPLLHSQGSAVLTKVADIPVIDIKALQAQCNQSVLSPIQCYEAFRSMGLSYGASHQGIEKINLGTGQALAKLFLPSSVSDTQNQFVLHPSVMDAALQTSIGLLMGAENVNNHHPMKLFLPFALDKLEIIEKCTAVMWCWVRYSEGSKSGDKMQKVDIDLCDEQGNVCVRLKGFSARSPEGETGPAGSQATPESLMLQPCWKEQAVAEEVAAYDYAQHLVILCEPADVIREGIKTQIEGVRLLSLESEPKEIAERFEDYATQVFVEIQNIINEKNKGKVLIQIIVFSQDEEQLFSGLAGLLKTAQLEHPRLVGQLIEVEPEETAEGIVAKLRTDRRSAIDSHIRYQDNKRWVAGWSEVKTSPENVGLPWKEQGVYLITGGAGGLGLIFAREITQRVKNATLILTGRSVLTENKQAQLRELEVLGAKVVYRQVDVTQAKAVAELIQNIRAEFGTIHGVIHSAGVIRDNLIIKKHKEEMQEVLAPKVTGLVNLDQATKALPLDFFILFSSVTGAFGNIGQCDYAVGNAFMDTYVKYRNVLADSGQRRGQTLSINWPLWKEGGMRIDAVAAKRMRQSMGLVAMQTATGIKALYQGLALGCGQAAVMEGDLKRIREVFLGEVINTDTTESLCTNESKDVTAIGENWLREKVVDFLKQLISAVIKLPADRLEEDAPMEKYGIDSIMIMQLTDRLEKTFGTLEKTLFFEYQSIQELSVYFLESYREQLLRLFATESEVAATMNDHRRFAAETEPVKKSLSSRRRSGIASFRTESREEKAMGALDIAIIGVAGRYPQAGNMKEFWENLRDGRDCITEIPSSRWEYGRYYTQEKDSIGTMYSKWGGFLADIDKFDSLLFNIAPLDAPRIDPQERLFLETVWETMEDAGYTRTGLGKHAKVGVFVGVMWGEYQLLGGGGIREAFAPPTASFASIANRVSYFYNFHGPSIALDTMCSSSLTAIHLACHSIQRGDCEMAIAGGVNLSLHPNKYIQLSQNRFLSSDGRCRSFGEGGDGYVPGEGVGAVLLKPLAKAVADQDQIYAVIKDVSINHGGKSNGYSVPNLNAQAELIDESLQKAQVDPRTITYIEAQGTGTSLGDPIEIGGLTKAYRNFTQDKQYCLVGSVKSNIGHLEAAAGIAALTKTLLQFKYKQIVPSLHSAKLNPNINFDHSPFYVQQKLSEWNSLVVNRNGISSPLPRRAAVNAFGAGGANAHMILEEYQSIPKAENQLPALSQIMVLSARTKNCLYEYAKRLCNFCSNASDQEAELDIADMVYTLHVGRESMQERLAIIGATLADFIAGLTSFLQRPEDLADQNTIFYGCATGASQLLHKEAPGDRLLHRLVEQRDLIELGKLWVDGAAVPWEKLYDGKAVRRISLPTYPFERKAYWILENNHHSMPAAESLRLPSTPGNNRLGQLPILNNFEEPVKDLELESDVVRRSYGDEVVPKRVIPAEYSVAVRMDTGYDDVENLISHIVVQNLGMEQNELNIDIDLGIYGLDSFTRIRIINDIQREFGDIVVSPEVIFEQNTVKKLAKYIEGEIKQGYPAISKAKARDESIIGNEHNVISPGMKDGRRLNSVKSQYPLLPNDTFGLKTNNILLNGVTGVLGSRLVCEYLERTDSMLFCLVRAKNTGQAKQRIRAMLEVYDPELSLLSEFDRRVIPVLGDITKPYLGMEPESYEELASRIDMVVHSAAKKSLHGVYSEVKAVNVDGTQNMVDFALRTKQKYFIHISTVYAIMGECKEKEGRTFKESDFELEQKFGNLGYSRSKFEAEKIVRSTQDLKWIIMRSGYIMGDSHKGYYPLNMTGIPDVFYDFIKTTIELEMAVNSPWYWDITPVDYISRSIVWLSTSLKDIKQTYHLSNPDYKTSKDIAAIISKLGYPIKFVSEEEYKNFLRRKGNRYRSIITELILFNPALIQNSYADTTYTTKILAQAGIYCPEIDEKLIATYLDYCIKVGYLKDIRQRDFESQQVQLPKSNTR